LIIYINRALIGIIHNTFITNLYGQCEAKNCAHTVLCLDQEVILWGFGLHMSPLKH